jgi:precorrin-3B C17-methyltransferase
MSGRLTVIGLGPGNADQVTPEASRAVAEAKFFYGYKPYLDRLELRPDQTRVASDNREELARSKDALTKAAEGHEVAVVSGGDPGVFAMAAAVCEAIEAGPAQWRAVEVAIVPGITAMLAVAARAGAPLGHDFCAISLSDQLKPWAVIEARLLAAASADLVVALYNPASQTRREQLARARDVLLRQRAAETPVVLARAIGSDEESLTITTLAGFDLTAVDMRTLVLVGSSQTRLLHGADGSLSVYTPRSYPA